MTNQPKRLTNEVADTKVNVPVLVAANLIALAGVTILAALSKEAK